MTLLAAGAQIFHEGWVGLTASGLAIVMLTAAQAFGLRKGFTLARTVVTIAAVVIALVALLLVFGRFSALS